MTRSPTDPARPTSSEADAPDTPDTPTRPGDAYVQSFARGLAVIRSFDASRPAQTLTEVAAASGLTRAGARRILLTLQALGYVEDASKVDKTKFPAYKPGAHCATCNFFQGKAADAYAPCQIFPGKAVAAKGWCASHSPKA